MLAKRNDKLYLLRVRIILIMKLGQKAFFNLKIRLNLNKF